MNLAVAIAALGAVVVLLSMPAAIRALRIACFHRRWEARNPSVTSAHG